MLSVLGQLQNVENEDLLDQSNNVEFDPPETFEQRMGKPGKFRTL